MSATMPTQGCRVQLKQSDMCLALNMAKMAKGWFSCTTREDTQCLINKPRAKVRDEKKRGVEFHSHKQVDAAMEWHTAMLRQNHTARCLHCQDGITKNPQTGWSYNGTGAPPPNRCRPPNPELTPALPRMPPAPTGNNSGVQSSQIDNLAAGYLYSHTSLPCAEYCTLDAYAQDSQHDIDFNLDMLTDEGTSTG